MCEKLLTTSMVNMRLAKFLTYGIVTVTVVWITGIVSCAVGCVLNATITCSIIMKHNRD